MNANNLLSQRAPLYNALLLALGLIPATAFSGVTDLSNSPLASGISTASVKPNIAFVVDDSGSMDDENMPDDDATNKGNRCWGWQKYNTLMYNPSYTYKPPFKIDGTAYSDGVTRYPDASFTAALKDGYFPDNGYTFAGGITSNYPVDLSNLANLTPNAVSCDTTGSAPGTGARATLTVGGSGSTSVSDIFVGGTDIFNGSATSASSTTSTVASRIAAKLTLNGYSATVSGNVVTIQAPISAGNVTSTPVITKSGSMTITATAFSGYTASAPGVECNASPSRYYYSTHKTDANSSTCAINSNYSVVTNPDSIEAPGVPNAGRTAAQIAAAKTNYANWYSYYRKRATLMKAATGEAFKDLDQSKFRVGLFFINSIESDAGRDYPYGRSLKNNDLKIADFTGATSGTQRYEWFSKLYSGRDGGWTPNRAALARMGRMFAGKISGWDPVQYSCQQNFTIQSTDGYWNSNFENTSSPQYGPLQIDGSTYVGDQDYPAAAAAGATASISIGSTSGSGSDPCYRFTTLTVNPGTGNLELMGSTSAPTTCTTIRDTLGQAVSDAINANTGSTGFTASYNTSTDKVTITAPTSLGVLTATPVFTTVRDSGTKSRSFTATAFTGGSLATEGAPLPYKDTQGSSNTLADVAYYYYQTDLRTSALGNCSNTIGSTTYNQLCDNNVLGSGKDLNSQQHMTTFTLGLGVSGTITYESNYESAPDIVGVTQYYDVANGSASWPSTSSSDGKIDDLWHAAVNGRGTYYSASNAETLKAGLQSALAGVQARTGSSAAAATSNLEPVAGDNFVYVALYRTGFWDGDLKSFSINPDTGAVSTSENWSAQSELDSKVSAAGSGNDGRTIKYFNSSAANKLKDFTSSNLNADGLDSYFTDICAKTPFIDQCGTDADDLTSTQKTAANDADKLVKYLRGQGNYENESGNATTANRLYRGREHVMGDIVNGVPVYMRKPPFAYDKYDGTYGTFKSNNAARAGTVFAAANDGMLHAFNADTGEERWAYVPRQVMPNLWKLADRNYPANHNYFVDGSPTVADICSSLDAADANICASASNWKTIVVGGLNKGGCGYYALDVTDPSNPKGLWEFTDPNLGFSFGNPVVAKRKNGQWVVFVTSGYNNYPGNGCGTTGDGNGHVFVLDAYTGTLLEDIETYTSGTTQAGSTSSPSGLAKLNAWIDDASFLVADRLYAGDLLGNLWRIDFDGNHAPSGKEAVRLATLKDSANNPQPITTKPELAEVRENGVTYPVVFVGTGKYLGSSDLSDTSKQSIYGLKDELLSTGISDVRSSQIVARTLTGSTGTSGTLAGRTIRTVSSESISWVSQNGWLIDLDPANASPGERVNVDMSLQFNLLTVAANVPEDNACNVGGYAYLYFLDINTGRNTPSSLESMAGLRLTGNALVAGIKTLRLTSGKTVTVVTDTAGSLSSEANPGGAGGTSATAKRTTWRELLD